MCKKFKCPILYLMFLVWAHVCHLRFPEKTASTLLPLLLTQWSEYPSTMKDSTQTKAMPQKQRSIHFVNWIIFWFLYPFLCSILLWSVFSPLTIVQPCGWEVSGLGIQHSVARIVETFKARRHCIVCYTTANILAQPCCKNMNIKLNSHNKFRGIEFEESILGKGAQKKTEKNWQMSVLALHTYILHKNWHFSVFFPKRPLK